MPLSQAQLKKLANGKSVQLKHQDICGCGIDIQKLSPATQKKIHNAWSKGKGIRLSLDDSEVEGAGLASFKKMAKSAVKVAKKKMMDAVQPVASAVKDEVASLAGEGIFGKKFDRKLKKAGIKKIAYQMGDVLKPVAKSAINNASALAATYVPAAAPAISMASKVAHDYLDEPDKYQGKDGFKEVLKTAVRGEGFAQRSYSGSGFARPSSVGGLLRPRVAQPLELREVSLSSKTNLPIGHPALINAPILQQAMAPRAL